MAEGETRLIGAHMSIAGGVDKAIERGVSIGCTTIQIFTGYNNRWASRPISGEDLARFEEKRSLLKLLFAHNNYLINLASPDPAMSRKSMTSMRAELGRAALLKLPFLVMHPGSHRGSGEEGGLQRIAERLDELMTFSAGSGVRILLETTAGQGTNLGYRFEHLARILSSIHYPERMGVCFDTCHSFAARYDMRTPQTYEETFSSFDRIIGLSAIYAFHLNDSKGALGSRRDRHQHIGEGFIGTEAFRLLLQDQRFRKVPMILETPKGKGMEEDRKNLALLRSLDTLNR